MSEITRKEKAASDSTSIRIPLVIILCLLVLDQITKIVVVRTIPLYYQTGYTIEVIGDFLRLIHARNLGVAFSIGDGLAPLIRKVLFILIPAVVSVGLFVSLTRPGIWRRLERYAVSLIVAGGLGNLIDRVLRPQGVVDFIDVKFYGLFGLERWPTFNVADSSIVVGGVLLIILTLFTKPDSDSQREPAAQSEPEPERESVPQSVPQPEPEPERELGSRSEPRTEDDGKNLNNGDQDNA